MSENETLIATADADTIVPDLVGPEITETTTVDIGGDVDRISVKGSAEDAGNPEEPKGAVMPDKFANAEDPQAALLKAYQELEKAQGKPVDPEAVPATEEVPAEEGSERQ